MAGTGKAHLRGEGAVLTVEDLVVDFPASGGRTVHAVSGISIDLLPGETLGIVGESGCGKSTTGRAILQLPRPTSGSVVLDGTDLAKLDEGEMRAKRTGIQMIFQDPISSLNPRRRIKDVVAEPLRVWGPKDKAEQYRIVRETLEAVGLDADLVGDRRPHEFSGGQRQRIAIARALVLNPKIIICDEPVSALDVSVQAQILNLLEDLKAKYGITLIFIAHDLGVVKNVSDRVAVMYLGKLCEVADSEALYRKPSHPYTRLLLGSVPVADPTKRPDTSTELSGDLPSPTDPPSGCRFRTRCPRATDRCAAEEPQLREVGVGHYVACHFPHE